MKAVNVVCFAAIYALVCYIKAGYADVDCGKPPRHIPLHMCCQSPTFSNDELLEQCAEFGGPPPHSLTRENNMPPKIHPPHHHGMPPPPPCFAECIFNKTELLDETGELNEGKFEYFVSAAVPDDEELAAVVKASFETCAENISEIKDEIAEKMEKHAATREFHPMCSPFAAMIWRCVNMEILRNCPASVWNDNEECNAARGFITECLGQ